MTTSPHTRGLASDLRAHVSGEVRFDTASRATYSTDASNYRQVPMGVVVPESVDDAVAAVRVCRDHGVPLHSRGGGTSLAGQCCNEGVAIDWSKRCVGVVDVDADRHTAIVEPGISLDALNAHLAPYDLMVGPKPSTHEACTIGGMIGNNSCGATAQAYGTMAASVVRLEVLTYDGLRTWVGATDDAEYQRVQAEGGAKARLYEGMRDLRDRHLADIRQGFPAIPRRISGYNLDALLPERGFDVAKALVGSEGTLVTILHAEISLFEVQPERTAVVLGYPDIAAAADDVVAIAAHEPTTLEGFDERLVDLERVEHLADEGISQLPGGHGWLIVQFSGTDKDTVNDRAQELIDDLHRRRGDDTVGFIADPKREDALWKAREAGLGATAFPPDTSETHEGWEDAAVAPENLGAYLRDFQKLLDEYDYGSASLYGHFGHGCVHTRLPSDLSSRDGAAEFRRFAFEAARLVADYGGSLSGEHGDGQSRGELLPIMFGDRVVTAFGEFKSLFDPDDTMNPGKVVHPYRLDENLRLGESYRPRRPETHFSFPDDDQQFGTAVNRCVGVGKCRSDHGGVMCPSYRVTREEEHSTRGRSRLLHEMMRGDVITDGWRSSEVHDALDLCLSCKGCKSDCPTSVDMATYKAEFLSHHYENRLRPLSHYSMGWLPLWARLAAIAPGVVNTVTQAGTLAPLLKRAGGIASRRDIPRFARRRFQDDFSNRDNVLERPKVLLWPDTFTNNLHPHIAHAAAAVLDDAGFHVAIPRRTGCCGLTWISTGQLATAKRVLRHTLDVLRLPLRAGAPIVVLEPSCAAVFRSDMPRLLPRDADARRLADQTVTLAELLDRDAPRWRVDANGQRASAQVHCHQHAELGYDAEEALLRRCGVDLDVMDNGCCGMAGHFGFEAEHYALSMACAEDGLLPAIRRLDGDTAVLADGFSCRAQIGHADVGHRPVHLAEILAAALPGTSEP